MGDAAAKESESSAPAVEPVPAPVDKPVDNQAAQPRPEAIRFQALKNWSINKLIMNLEMDILSNQ